MKVVLAYLMILGGVLQGQGHDWEKKKLNCGLEITQYDRVSKEVLEFQMRVELIYSGARQQMVRGDQGLQLLVVTKDGKEVPTKVWGADGTREAGLSDFHMLRGGDGVIFSFGIRAYEREGLWFLSWTDALGNYHGCKLKSLDGIKLVMKYTNDAKEDFKLKLSDTSTLEVKQEEIWIGTVRSKEVPLVF